jgi:hypothetical protein
VGEPEGNGPVRRIDLCRNIIFKRILEKWDRVVWTGLIWPRIGTSGDLL